jgi:hypothetical protein
MDFYAGESINPQKALINSLEGKGMGGSNDGGRKCGLL